MLYSKYCSEIREKHFNQNYRGKKILVLFMLFFKCVRAATSLLRLQCSQARKPELMDQLYMPSFLRTQFSVPSGFVSVKTDAVCVIQFPSSVQSSGRREERASTQIIQCTGSQDVVVLVNYTSVMEVPIQPFCFSERSCLGF